MQEIRIGVDTEEGLNRPGGLDSIAVSVFVFILIDFDNKYNKYTKKSDCEMSWLV